MTRFHVSLSEYSILVLWCVMFRLSKTCVTCSVDIDMGVGSESCLVVVKFHIPDFCKIPHLKSPLDFPQQSNLFTDFSYLEGDKFWDFSPCRVKE